MSSAPASVADVAAAPAGTAGARPQLYAAAIVLLLANAVAAKVLNAFALAPPLPALIAGAGLSWATWFAFAAAVRLALKEPAAPVRPRDLVVSAACALAALVPLSQVAAFAASGLAGAILLDRAHGRYLRAAALVTGAISVQLAWSRLVMLLFTRPVAWVDAHLVGAVVGRPASGHDIVFADGSHTLSVAAGCTSVQNASVALVLYVAIVRTFRPQPRWRPELLALAGVFASVVALNTVRLSLMAQSLPMFHLVHDGAGAGLVNGVVTFVGLAWAAASVRHELFE
jgi:exosortase/archaeosortase family protein